MCVQNVLISCSLDSSIKVWQPVDSPTPGAVIDIAPVYVQPPEESEKPVRSFDFVWHTIYQASVKCLVTSST